MKTKPYLWRSEVVVLACLVATPLQAQSLAGGYSDALGLGAMGGIIVILLAWAQSLRRQLRRVVPLTASCNGQAEVHAQENTPAAWQDEHDSLLTLIKEAEAKLETTHKQLMEASRVAGMAEVATTVLHNVGNVLNSVNISASLVADRVKNSKTANLARAARMLQQHAADLPGFLTHDPRGSRLPAYFASLSECLATEQSEMLAELSSLCGSIEHIKEIVAMQQAYAKVAGLQETLNATELLEDALRLNAGAVERHHVQVIREFSETPPLLVDKHKVLQILVNLIRNAKYALEDRGPGDKRMILRAAPGENGSVKISVIDNGVGIAPENLSRIFEHGFTTRSNGHGFALHSGVLAARQMGGNLTCHSAGPSQGATFTLELPLRPPEAAQ